MSRPDGRGLRWTIAAGLTLVALAVGAGSAAILPERYSGAPILLRDWMLTTSAGVAGITALALSAAAWAGQGAARWLWILGALAAVAHGALPYLAGAGPWPHGSWLPRALTILTLLPAALRALGSLAAGARAAGTPRKAVLGLAAADLAVVALVAAQGATAVMARAHPADGRPLLLLPAAACAVALASARATRR